MFRDSRAQDRQRTASSFNQAVTRYSGNEQWFDGTVGSIDQRLATCNKLIHHARFTVARVSIADSGGYLQAARSLESDQRSLVALRDDLLTGGSAYGDPGPPGYRSAGAAEGDRPRQYRPTDDYPGSDYGNEPEPPQRQQRPVGDRMDGLLDTVSQPGFDLEQNGREHEQQSRAYADQQEALHPYDDSEDDLGPRPQSQPDRSGRDPGFDQSRGQQQRQVGDERDRAQQQQREQTVAPQMKGPVNPDQPTGPSGPYRPGPIQPPNQLRPVNDPYNPAAESDSHWKGDQNTTWNPDAVKGQMSLFGDSPSGDLPSLNKYISQPAPRRAHLAGTDHRWVELESARFIAANAAALGDSHEMAVRAHDHAAMKTSTFTPERSAEICRAFVASVGELGQRTRQARVARVTAQPIDIDFDASMLYL